MSRRLAAKANDPAPNAEQQLAELSWLVHRLGTELPALTGELAEAEAATVSSEIARARKSLAEAQSLLDHAQRVTARRQRALLRRRAQAGPLKLNLAAGESQLPGWVNLDAQVGELRHCLQWQLPLPTRSVSHAYFAHGLEHLYLDLEALPLLRELRRVLRVKGTLRIVVPDIGALCKAYVAQDTELFAMRRAIWLWERSCRTALEQLLTYSGANTAPHGFFCHKFGYDFPTLCTLLNRAGFRHVERSAFMASRHLALRIDDTSEAGALAIRGEHLSLFVEASP